MINYFKGYIYRIKDIIITMSSIVISLCFVYLLFFGRIYNINNQLNSYHDSDYKFIYVLNFQSNLPNECIFPDFDIQFFLDDKKQNRISVSSVMAKHHPIYNMQILNVVKTIPNNGIIISNNVANKYNLKIGDLLYAQLPNNSNLYHFSVFDISNTNYYFINPNIDNDIGMVFVGNIQAFETNLNNKTILFSNESVSRELSIYPQIIDSIINKSQNEKYVFAQGISPLIIQLILSIISIIISYNAFFAKSFSLLKIYYRKGMKRKTIIGTLFLEKIIISLMPCLFVTLILSKCINKLNQFTILYFSIPIFLWMLFIIISSCIYIKRVFYKGD